MKILTKSHRLWVFLFVLTVLLTSCGRKGPEAPPDTTPPTVIATSPYYGVVSVPMNIAAITATFDEEMNPSSINAETIVLETGNTESNPVKVSGIVTYADKAAVFTPEAELSPNTLYRLIVGAGVRDLAGNGLVTPYYCIFTTGTASTSYTITPSVPGGGGSISPGTPQSVNYNGSLTFTVTADSGYQTVDVLVDNASIGIVSTFTFTNVTANHTISASFANDAPSTHTVSAAAGANGSITPGSATVTHGGTAQFTVTADGGYHIASVSGCGGGLSGSTYTTGAITADCTITASFAADAPVTHTVTASAGANGSITPKSATVNHGGAAQFTVSADGGYHIASISGCGGGLSGSTYTTGAITADCTITASFAADAPVTHTVTASAGAGGSISPGSATVTHGVSTEFTVTADGGYHIASATGCGGSLSGIVYTTGSITGDCTVSVSFAADAVEHTISAKADDNGEIIPAGDIKVPDGGSQAFEIKTSGVFIISSIEVDGDEIGLPRLTQSFFYTFSSVTSNHKISAKFKRVWQIDSSAVGTGTINPSGIIEVIEGAAQSFEIAPSLDSYILTVSVDGASIGPVPIHQFEDVTANHSIQAIFETRAPGVEQGVPEKMTALIKLQQGPPAQYLKGKPAPTPGPIDFNDDYYRNTCTLESDF